jgi:hypothetical protein
MAYVNENIFTLRAFCTVEDQMNFRGRTNKTVVAVKRSPTGVMWNAFYHTFNS